jgi:hypothetical protein
MGIGRESGPDPVQRLTGHVRAVIVSGAPMHDTILRDLELSDLVLKWPWLGWSGETASGAQAPPAVYIMRVASDGDAESRTLYL